MKVDAGSCDLPDILTKKVCICIVCLCIASKNLSLLITHSAVAPGEEEEAASSRGAVFTLCPMGNQWPKNSTHW